MERHSLGARPLMVAAISVPAVAKLAEAMAFGPITRTFDCEEVNGVANDPAIRPHIGAGTDWLDLSVLVENTCNQFLFGVHGGFGFIWTSPGVYEVHALVLPTGRGKWARFAADKALSAIREAEARQIWTRTPSWATHAQDFAREFGMRQVGGEVLLEGIEPVEHLWFLRDLEVAD